jgi:poly-beta-1,6-N-acetyl-D-glucosamine N-deacetylase
VSAAKGSIKTFDVPGPATPGPDRAGWTRHPLRLARLSLRIFLALAAAAALCSPFAFAFYRHYQQEWFSPQLNIPPARFSARELGEFRAASAAATHAQGAEPIILAYSDIAWHSPSRYVVTPTAFEAQMAMLHAAGYHTLTARQLVRYAQGGSVPSRSVAITFDGGARGLWTYADKILRRYRFHGIAFLITSRIGVQQPYYLTWQEIRRMHSSGYWDFESYTNALDQKAPVAPGRLGDPLTQRIWLPSKHRLETMSAFARRVRKDLTQSIVVLERNNLPSPTLFAYPFSGSLGDSTDTASMYAGNIIRRLFALALTNDAGPPAPFSDREAAGDTASRLEVTSSDTAASLFLRLEEIASLPVADTSTFDDRVQWLAPNTTTATVSLTGREVMLEGQGKWNYAAYAPGATADWDGYEISAEIAPLSSGTDPSATISVRVGSAAQLNVSVANHYMDVTLGNVLAGVTVLAKELPAALAHRVTIDVFPDATVVSVDSEVAMSWACTGDVSCVPPTNSPSTTGGFALSAFRRDASAPFARFDDVTVERLES